MASVAFTPGARGLVSGGLDMILIYWDVSRLVGGPGSGRDSPGVLSARQGDGACTMNFTGHKVCAGRTAPG